jgi:L-lactate dehydrogenase
LRDVCLSVPTVVGCGGVRQQVELALTAKEKMGLQQSARVLRETIRQVEDRIGGAPSTPAAPIAAAKNGHNAVPRSAWQTARSK